MRKFIHRALGKASRLAYQPPVEPPEPQFIRTREWFMIDGDKTRRLDYPLDSKSVVFDLGGYEGQWASDIVGRFNCKVYVFEPMPAYAEAITERFAGNSRVSVYPFGLAGRDQTIDLSVDEASSSGFKATGETVSVPLKSVSDFIAARNIDHIDLMKINIEGGEYELLEQLIKTGEIAKITDLQIQFHDFVPDAEKRMRAIQDKLSKTHFLTYQYPFVWDNWRRRDRFEQTVTPPTVSVVMAAYNAEEFLRPAIDSILAQTLPSFELVIVNDGSTDTTEKIITSYHDPRIVYIKQENKGLAAALNVGIKKARGAYIARMDADDIALPLRLQSQADFLNVHPSVALVGSSYVVLDEKGKTHEQFTALTEPDDVREDFLVRNPFGHGTVMFRKTVCEEIGGYDETPGSIEDYDLWWRIAAKHPVSNIATVLYQWRVVATGISHGSSAARQQPIREVMDEIWRHNRPQRLTAGAIKARYHSYRGVLPAKIGAQLADQYIHNQYAIGLAMVAKGRRTAGWARIAAAGQAVPESVGILSDLYYLNRSMRGYNLNLLLKDLKLPGQKINGLIRRFKKELPI